MIFRAGEAFTLNIPFIAPFQLKSVFDTSIMPYTNFTYDFKGMIDYAFYPVRTMKPLGYLGPISQEWLDDNKVVGCPHPHITSGQSVFPHNCRVTCIVMEELSLMSNCKVPPVNLQNSL